MPKCNFNKVAKQFYLMGVLTQGVLKYQFSETFYLTFIQITEMYMFVTLKMIQHHLFVTKLLKMS